MVQEITHLLQGLSCRAYLLQTARSRTAEVHFALSGARAYQQQLLCWGLRRV
jgi:hypothetical protein